MRISDWSSDVCSSDLRKRRQPVDRHPPRTGRAVHPSPGRNPVAARVRTDRSRAPLSRGWAGRQCDRRRGGDRTSVVQGKSVSVRVDLGGRRILKTNQLLPIAGTSSIYRNNVSFTLLYLTQV